MLLWQQLVHYLIDRLDSGYPSHARAVLPTQGRFNGLSCHFAVFLGDFSAKPLKSLLGGSMAVWGAF
jgi:hypothetical protein